MKKKFSITTAQSIFAEKRGLMPPVRVIALIFLLIGAETAVASNATVEVSATVSGINNCKFNTGDSTLNLGVLDPNFQIDRTIKTSLIFKCSGSDDPAVFFINSDFGSFEAGSDIDRKMSHSSMLEAYIPYRLSVDKASGERGRDEDQYCTISIKVKGSDFSEVYSGSYSDVVYISIDQ